MKRDRVSQTALAVARITDIIFRDGRLGGILPPRTGEWTSRFLDASLPGWKRWLLRRRLMDRFARSRFSLDWLPAHSLLLSAVSGSETWRLLMSGVTRFARKAKRTRKRTGPGRDRL